MKRITKLLVVVLALCLMLGSFGLVASAEGAETLFFYDLVTGIRRSEGAETQESHNGTDVVTFQNFKFWAGYGKFNPDDVENSDFNNFAAFKGDGVAVWDDQVLDSDTDMKFTMQRWQWAASGDQQSIIRVTALVDSYVIVCTDEEIKDQWATDMTVLQYVVDAEGTAVKVREELVKNATGFYAFFSPVHLKAGDSVYVILQANGYLGTNGVVPHFAIDPAGYDANERADFATAKELKTAKNDAYTALDNTVAALKEADYSSGNWSKIFDYVTIAKADISDLMDADEINAVVTKAKADIDAVLTIAEEEAALQAERDAKKAELAAEFKQEWYTKKNWELVQAALDKAYAAIDAAKNTAAMNTAMTVARTEIADVEVGGCGTTKQAEAGIVLGGLAAAIVVFTKKREN